MIMTKNRYSIIEYKKYLNMNAIYFIRYSETIRNFFQNQHDSVIQLFGGNKFYVDVWVPIILTTTLYWFFGALFIILDLTKWPKFLYKYKIHDNKKVRNQISTEIILKQKIEL